MTICAERRQTLATALAPLLLVALLGGCASSPSKPSTSGNAEQAAAAKQGNASDQLRSAYQSALKLMQQGNDEAATKALRELSTSAPQWSGPPTNLGIVLARNQHWKQAAAAFAQAVHANPQNQVAAVWLGVARRHQGDYQGAEQAYREALKINPNNADAHLDLGILYDAYLHQPAQAVTQYRQYLSASGKNDLIVQAWIRALTPQPASASTTSPAKATPVPAVEKTP